MRSRRVTALALGIAALLVTGAPASGADVEMTFYGNQHFKFVTPGGQVILINPWVKGNPD